ncbi:hypothetical protein D3C80_1425400 [compost metagenome]
MPAASRPAPRNSTSWPPMAGKRSTTCRLRAAPRPWPGMKSSASKGATSAITARMLSPGQSLWISSTSSARVTGSPRVCNLRG